MGNLRDRNEDALLMQNACNPSGVAHSIAAHFSALIGEGADTATLQNNPAMRLMVAKLADLMRLDVSGQQYAAVYLTVKEKAPHVDG